MIYFIKMFSNYCRRVQLSRINNACYCTIALKHGLGDKLKWIPPERMPLEKAPQSGDCEPLQEIDLTDCPNEFKKSEELKTADELVKRVFSFEFMRRKEIMNEIKLRAMMSVQRHKLDFESLETRIARKTIVIRNLQLHMEKHPYDTINRVLLKEAIEKRGKWLYWLRLRDYKCFEWLLERLNLIFKPQVRESREVTRELGLQKLADKYCDDLRENRMKEYRELLESQQMGFLKEKLETLKTIKREEEECGVEPSVMQEDIDKVIMKIKEFEEKEPDPIPTLTQRRRRSISA